MIIWINGAFGSGKTQTAYELHRRLPNSYVYDPERAGYFIRKNMPPTLQVSDFQDYPMWRSINLDMLDYIAEHRNGDIIVPMTIANRTYYNEMIGALSQKHEVKHFILYASKNTLLKRLASRFETRQSWAALQIDRCIKAFDNDIVEKKIYSDDMNISQAVEKIAELAGISLLEDHRSSVRKHFDRMIVQYKHIR